MTINQALTVLQDARTQFDRTMDTTGVQKSFNKIKDLIDSYLSGIKDLQNENQPLCLGVVGQMKAGKSSFLNTWLFDGETVLPIAATPMTAGLTTLEYTDDTSKLEICYYSKEDWDHIKEESQAYKDLRETLLEDRPELKGKEAIIEKEMEKYATVSQFSSFLLTEGLTSEAREKIGKEPIKVPFENIHDLQTLMNDCVGASGKFTSVVSILKIYLKDDRLKGLRIVDTPGVNDPVVSREVRTHQYLHKCHGVFMLSRADHFMGADDINFMNQRLASVGVNSILIIGSKYDGVLINPQYKNLRLVEAISEAKRSLKDAYQRGLQQLKNEIVQSICGCVFSAGMAESVLIKLKNVNFDVSKVIFDRYEQKFWENMTTHYPSDFQDEKTTTNSLNLLADFESINNIVKNRFKSRYKEIMVNKRRMYIDQLVCVITEAAERETKSLQHELEYIRTADFDSLQALVNTLELGVYTMVKPLQRIIDTNAQQFQNNWLNVEENILSKRGVKVEAGNVSTISQRVDYTRKTTFWGRTTSGYVYVDIINRESAKEQQRSAMEKYKQTIISNWEKVYTNFHDELLKKLTEKLGSLDSITMECSLLIMEIVRQTFDVELAKFEVLRLDGTLNSHISKINEFIDESSHSSFNKSFGEKKESDADENVKGQAREKLKNVQSGIDIRDGNYMNAMKSIPDSTIINVAGDNGVLMKMRNDIAVNLKEGIALVLAEKRNQLNNKQKTIDELQDGIECLQKIKHQLNG